MTITNLLKERPRKVKRPVQDGPVIIYLIDEWINNNSRIVAWVISKGVSLGVQGADTLRMNELNTCACRVTWA